MTTTKPAGSHSPTPCERVIAAIPPAYGEPIEGFSDQRKVYGLAPQQQRGYAFAHRELVHAFERAKAEALSLEASAVNSHAELVEALRELVGEYDAAGMYCPALTEARALLAKVGG